MRRTGSGLLIAALSLLLSVVASSDSWSSGVFDQSDWTVHNSDPDTMPARHPRNSYGWLRYYTAPGSVGAGDVLTLRTAMIPLAEGSDTDFSAGTLQDVVIRGSGEAAYLALGGGLNLGDGADGALVIDGRVATNSTDGLAHPKSISPPTGVTAWGTGSGTLAGGSYTFAVTAMTAAGETGGYWWVYPAQTGVDTTGAPQDVLVSWSPAPCSTGYRIYRNWRLVGQVGAGVTTFTDNGSTNLGAWPGSNTTARPYVFTRPLNLTSLLVQDCAAATANAIQWLSAPAGISATELPGAGSLQLGTRFFYSVRTVDASSVEGKSGPENNITISMSMSAVGLSWGAVAGAEHYRVYRGLSSGSFPEPSLVCETSGTSCTDTGAPPSPGTPTDGNPTRGGRIVIRGLQDISIDDTSLLDVSGLGYPGAATGWGWYDEWECDAGGGYTQGWSAFGTPGNSRNPLLGGGGGSTNVTDWCSGAGGYAGNAGYGGSGLAGSDGLGGLTYGSPALEVVYPGSGGGENGSYSDTYENCWAPCGGAAGGGMIDFTASQIFVNGALAANGGSGAGSGSGGSIRLRGLDLVSLGNLARLSVAGGTGAGGGRIAIYTPSGNPAIDPGATMDRGPVGVQQGSYYPNGVLGTFVSSGAYVSAVHDAGGFISEVGTVTFTGTLPPGTSVRIHVVSSPDGASFGPFLGPGCTEGPSDSYSSGQFLCANHIGDRYLKWKIELSSSGGFASPTMDRLEIKVATWSPPGVLVSSPFDTADDTGRLASLTWTAQTPPGTAVRLQLRTAPDSGSGNPGTWSAWLGPTGTTELDSWYTDPSGAEGINPLHRDWLGDRWLQYRVDLSASKSQAPSVSQVTVGYAASYSVDALIDGNGSGLFAAPGTGLGGKSSKLVEPGTPVSFVVEIQNLGLAPDTFILSWSALADFTATVDGSPSPIFTAEVGPGATSTHTLTVTSPSTAAGSAQMILNAVSANDGAKGDSVTAELNFIAKNPAGGVSPASPVHGATAVPLSTRLCWTEPNGSRPLTYQMLLATDSGFTQLVDQRGSPNVDFPGLCVDETLTAATRYYWRVRADNPFFNPGPWPLQPWEFETGHPPVSVSALYPSNGLVDVHLTVTLTWLPGTGGPGSAPLCYDVGFGLDDAAAQLSAVPSPDCDVSLTIGPLELNTGYRWCVRGTNAFGTGPWSCFGFTTIVKEEIQPPAAPIWTNPTDGATGMVLNPELRWQAGPGPQPDCYQVGVGLGDTAAQGAAVSACTGTQPWEDPLVQGTVYRACVRGTISSVAGPWSCIGFTTGRVPTAPTPVFPANGTGNIVPPTVFLGWTPPTGVVPMLGYRVRLWEAADPQSTLVEKESLTQFADMVVSAARIYEWNVLAFNDIGDGPPSEVWSFSTAPDENHDPPTAPLWTTPADGASGVGLKPELAWQAGPGPQPDCYEVGVGLDDTAARSAAVSACTGQHTWESPLLPATDHRACVRGSIALVLGPWSCIGFTTAGVPGAPTLASPENGASGIVPPTVVLRWVAPSGDIPVLGYRVSLWEAGEPQSTLAEKESGTESVELEIAAAKTYEWSVLAFNAIGDGPPSEVWSFSSLGQSTELRAVAQVSPQSGIEGVTNFLFDGSGSVAPAGASIKSYSWDFGNGSPPISAAKISYVYRLAGGYRARLLVTDDAGHRAEATVPVTVLTSDGRVPPTVRATVSPTIGPAPLTVQLSATVGNGSGMVVALVWDLGDRTSKEGNPIEYTFTAVGTYVVRVTAVDDQGLSASDFAIVAVSSPDSNRLPPVVRAFASPPSVTVGEPTVPECTAFDPQDPAASFIFRWVLDVLGEAEGARPGAQVFTQAGLYSLTCKAKSSSSGLESQDSVSLEVTTSAGLIPPRIVTEGATEACIGEPYAYNPEGQAAARGSRPLVWKLGKVIDNVLVGAPGGFNVDPTTGITTWTPAAEQAGTQRVILRVESAAGQHSQDYNVEVKDCAEPKPPDKGGGGCGCGSTSSGSVLAPLVLAALLLFRRRRMPVI